MGSNQEGNGDFAIAANASLPLHSSEPAAMEKLSAMSDTRTVHILPCRAVLCFASASAN